MKWFRFYSEAMHDPKVQQLRPALFKFWVNCLSLANEQPQRGTLPNVSEIAFSLRMNRPVVERYIIELLAAELVHRIFFDSPKTDFRLIVDQSTINQRSTDDQSSINRRLIDDRFTIHEWATRQFASDDVTARVKRHRKKTSVKTPEANVTLHDASRNGECNVPHAPVITDTDSDTDTDSSPYAPPPEKCARLGEDLMLVNRAIEKLGSDVRTEALGAQLGRMHATAVHLETAGWKWLRAAEWVLAADITESKRRSFAYLAKIASNLSDADREPKPKPARETATERKRREFIEENLRLKAKEQAENEDR